MAFENPFKKMPKPAIYASIAGFVGITGYLAYRHHASTGSWNPWSSSSSTTPSATTSTTTIDPVTGLPVSQDDAIDPLTNLAYLAEATEYGSVAAAEAAVSQFGLGSNTGNGIGTQVNGSPSGYQTGSNYSNDAAWAQAVQAGLTDVGYDATTVAAALGQFLTRQPLSTSGSPSPWQIVGVAIAEYGSPPSGITPIQAPPSSPANTATVPSVTGKTVAEASSAITAAGLVPGAHSTDTGTVNGQSPTGGTKVAPNSKVDLSVAAKATTPPPPPKGKGAATVPDVTGKTSANAVKELKNYGFVPGLNGSGTVVSQTPRGGTVAPDGSKVDIHAEAKK